MPAMTTLLIVGVAWVLLLAFTVALLAGVGRTGKRMEAQDEAEWEALTAPETRPVLVADTGGIRAHLRAAASGLIDAEQLTVTADVDGTEAVLASSRAVVEARAGDWPELTEPIRLGGQKVATLRAVRRPGTVPFDETDRLMLRALAARVAGSMESAQTHEGVPLSTPGAMA